MSEKRDFDAAAKKWDESGPRVELAREVAEAIQHEVELGPEMRLMDYGCGTGLVTLALQPQVREVVAADSSEGMLEKLGEKLKASGIGNVEAVRLDLEEGEWQGEPFDVIVSSMTLHHIEQAGLVVRRLAAALVEGGVLAIADLAGGSEAFHSDNTGVMHFGFSAAERKKMFEAAGLREVRTVEAARRERTGEDGETREFAVLLTVGVKS